jgi:hypothetical protein
VLEGVDTQVCVTRASGRGGVRTDRACVCMCWWVTGAHLFLLPT